MFKKLGLLPIVLLFVSLSFFGLSKPHLVSSQITNVVGPIKPSVSCPQPNRQQDINTLTLQDRIDQGYLIPHSGKKIDPSLDKAYHDYGTHFCPDSDIASNLKFTKTMPYALSRPNSGYLTSRTWSGYSAVGGGYTFVEAEWNANCIAKGWNDRYGTWVGIEGYGNNNLVQTGTLGENAAFITGYYAWVMNLAVDSKGAQEVFTIGCGDLMYAEVGAGDCMQVVDFSLNYSSGWRCYGPNANQGTAECIVEAPQALDGSVYYLSNFGTQTMTNCQVEINAGSTQWLSSVPNDQINMYDGGTLLAQTGSIYNSTDFNVTWKNYS